MIWGRYKFSEPVPTTWLRGYLGYIILSYFEYIDSRRESKVYDLSFLVFKHLLINVSIVNYFVNGGMYLCEV